MPPIEFELVPPQQALAEVIGPELTTEAFKYLPYLTRFSPDEYRYVEPAGFTQNVEEHLGRMYTDYLTNWITTYPNLFENLSAVDIQDMLLMIAIHDFREFYHLATVNRHHQPDQQLTPAYDITVNRRVNGHKQQISRTEHAEDLFLTMLLPRIPEVSNQQRLWQLYKRFERLDLEDIPAQLVKLLDRVEGTETNILHFSKPTELINDTEELSLYINDVIHSCHRVIDPALQFRPYLFPNAQQDLDTLVIGTMSKFASKGYYLPVNLMIAEYQSKSQHSQPHNLDHD